MHKLKTLDVPTYLLYFRNGAERSGLFCVVLYVAQQIMTQQKVDIFSAVKHIRLYRPHCIVNEVWFSHFFRFMKPHQNWSWDRAKYFVTPDRNLSNHMS